MTYWHEKNPPRSFNISHGYVAVLWIIPVHGWFQSYYYCPNANGHIKRGTMTGNDGRNEQHGLRNIDLNSSKQWKRDAMFLNYNRTWCCPIKILIKILMPVYAGVYFNKQYIKMSEINQCMFICSRVTRFYQAFLRRNMKLSLVF